MNELLNEVTPLTRGIIWLTKDESDTKNPHYKEIDYLLDGLLTANLQTSVDVSSRVIVGKNFNQSLYVLIAKELKRTEIESYLSLLKDLTSENDILVIDEVSEIEKLKSQVGKLSTHFRVIQ